jgi:hypothetical protein
MVVVAATAPGSTLAIATATPTALGDTIFFMKLSDNPTIVGIVGVLFMEDAVAATSTFITLYAGTAKVGLLPVGGSVGGTRSSALHLLALHANVLS